MSKIKNIYILSFIFSLHIAIPAYINSTFLTNFIEEKFVGILYTIASVLTLILLSKSSTFLQNFGNKKSILIFLTINIISLIGLIFSRNSALIAMSFILFLATNTLTFFCMDIFIEHFSSTEKTGKTRGLYLTILNTAYMLSPLIAAFIITKEGGYKSIYILALIMVIIMTLGLLFSVKKFNDRKYKRIPFFETFKELLKNKSLKKIVYINFLLQFFYAWMVVYTPIYLFEHMNFGWEQIGIIFTIMLAPFVILGFPIGILIDKYNINKKKILNIGFLFLVIFTSIIFFINTNNIILWAIILFMTRIGASLIETTSEISFFSQTGDEDASLIGLYRDMSPIAYIIAPALATVVFLIFPFKYLFIILGLIMSFGFIIINKIKKEDAISH